MSWAAGIVIALGFLLIALQLAPRILARRTVGRPVRGLPGPLGKAIDAGGDVIAVFASPSCPACRRQEPVVQSLQKEFPFLFRVNVAEHQDLARAFGVMATPTTVALRRGTIRAVLPGIQSEATLRWLLHETPEQRP